MHITHTFPITNGFRICERRKILQVIKEVEGWDQDWSGLMGWGDGFDRVEDESSFG